MSTSKVGISIIKSWSPIIQASHYKNIKHINPNMFCTKGNSRIFYFLWLQYWMHLTFRKYNITTETTRAKSQIQKDRTESFKEINNKINLNSSIKMLQNVCLYNLIISFVACTFFNPNYFWIETFFFKFMVSWYIIFLTFLLFICFPLFFCYK